MRFCPQCGSRYQHERFCPEDGTATQSIETVEEGRDARLGTVVDGRYRIESKLGEGGMGVVYRATHIALQKPLALKMLRPEQSSDPDVVQRFMQEAQAASAIGHENIVDINDFGRLPDGTAYFVMEYLTGQPLSQLISKGGSIPTGDAVHILRQVASALDAAHERGIVHRDLKPDNVMVLTRGELANFVKVLDFGIAKVGSARNKLTRTGMVFGTPHYMSPEQAAGQSVDARTDIYSLGVMMYEMFTGRVPFDGDTFMGVLNKHMFEKPAPMFRAGVERQLGAVEQITMRALEKKPELRYASMGELMGDLDRVLGGGLPRTMQAQRPSVELADALEPRTHSELRIAQRLSESLPPLPISRRWLYGLAGAGAVALLAALALSLRDGVPNPPEDPVVTAVAQPAPPPRPAELRDASLPQVVRVESEPTGAEVQLEGKLLGRTPLAVARPEQGESALQLRMEGHLPESVRLARDAPATVRVSLRRRNVASLSKPVPAPSRPVAPTPAAAAPRVPAAARKRPPSDVLDPWE